MHEPGLSSAELWCWVLIGSSSHSFVRVASLVKLLILELVVLGQIEY